ncbi:MASE4 domain-containing protein [Escherichia coli]|uniref:MASE4 domain-containing protein n=1 Tax=Escherichia coli TaxID=562 RepID=UPI003DA18C19
MIFIFLLLYYVSNQRQLSLNSFIRVLSNTYYLLEVAIISLSPLGNDLSTIYQKSNDIAIYYLFRQFSFISIIFLAVYSTNVKNKSVLEDKET